MTLAPGSQTKRSQSWFLERRKSTAGPWLKCGDLGKVVSEDLILEQEPVWGLEGPLERSAGPCPGTGQKECPSRETTPSTVWVSLLGPIETKSRAYSFPRESH